MTEKEQAFINTVSQTDFYNECISSWEQQGHPLIGDMGSLILEEYNNEAIDKILSRAYAAGQLKT